MTTSSKIDMVEATPESVGMSSSRLANMTRLVQRYVEPLVNGSPAVGVGFGLGFAVLLDPARAQLLGTAGEYHWGGANSTAFFVSPAEEMAVIFMTQLRPSGAYPVRRELRIASYQAITD